MGHHRSNFGSSFEHSQSDPHASMKISTRAMSILARNCSIPCAKGKSYLELHKAQWIAASDLAALQVQPWFEVARVRRTAAECTPRWKEPSDGQQLDFSMWG